jgi:hypothetical protein
LPDERFAIQEAVLEAIGDRPEHEAWNVRIDEPFDRPDYIIDIEGPSFQWRRAFFGPVEQTGEFIAAEIRRALAGTPKLTVLPLRLVHPDISFIEPFLVWRSVTIENVENLLSSENLKPWREHIAPHSYKRLTSARVALVHRFSSKEAIGRIEDDSNALLFKIFTLLRLIRPTREEFFFVQADIRNDGRADVFRVSEPPPIPLNLPVSELINLFRLSDFERLKAETADFLDALKAAPNGLRRAIGFFNVGYQGINESVIQIITWVMGIEAIFNSDGLLRNQRELIDQIEQCVGADTDLYAESAMSSYFGNSPRTVRELISELFELRNRLVHGLWVPSSLEQKTGHGTPGGQPVPYADVLREAAFHILRLSIRNMLLNPLFAVGRRTP